MAMATEAPIGLALTTGVGVLPLEEEAVRAVYARFELHVAGAVRALTMREPVRAVEPSYVDPRWFSSAPPARHAPLPQLVPAGPSYVQETLF